MTGFKLARIFELACTDPRVIAANRRIDRGDIPDEVIDGLLTDLEAANERHIENEGYMD